MSSSSDEDEKPIKRWLTFSRKRYGQRIPKELAVLRAKANSKYIFGEIEETKQILEQMIKKYPFYQEAYQVYGLICLDLNNFSKATNYFMLAAKRKGSSSLWLKIANLLKQQERFDLASIYFGKVLKKDPNNINIMWERVDCFEKANEYQKGIVQLEKMEQLAIQLKHNQLLEQTLKRMARIYVKKNQLEDAKVTLQKLELNDGTLNMLCEIYEKENNFDSMRQLLDKAFGQNSMREIIAKHDYKIITFYLLCGFDDYQQIVDHYQYNDACIAHLIELTEKLEKPKQEKLIEILYSYRNSYQSTNREKILFKYANNSDHSDQSSIPEEPVIPNNKDQIYYIYTKLKSYSDVQLAQSYLKILSFEQKSYHKTIQVQLRSEAYLFGKMKKRRLKSLTRVGVQSLSQQIGHEKFFEMCLDVFQRLLETDSYPQLFQTTYKTYQLRLKKIANTDLAAYQNFMTQISKYGLLSALSQKQFVIAPIYVRYLQQEPLLLNLIGVIYRNVSPEHKTIVNSFTRNLKVFESSVLNQNYQIGNPLSELLISLNHLQTMTGRLANNPLQSLELCLKHFNNYAQYRETSEVYYNLARIYLHLNIVSKGQELMEKVLEMGESSVQNKAAFTLMQLHKKMGNTDQALYLLRKYNRL